MSDTSKANKKEKAVNNDMPFPTDKDGAIIPGTYQTSVGEVRIKKIEPAKSYDLISVARSMNDNFAKTANELFSPEIEAVHEAMKTGIYVSWRPREKPWDQQDCQRVSSKARCFCGHMLSEHEGLDIKKIQFKCEKAGCSCRSFNFVPSRPEETGEFWLRKRRDFDIVTYRVRCRCKHTHEEHESYPPPHRCRARGCGCSGFASAFVCAACDKPWQDHHTIFETEEERRSAGRQVGEDWLPFSELPALSQITLTGVDNPNVQTLADALPTKGLGGISGRDANQLPGPSKR